MTKRGDGTTFYLFISAFYSRSACCGLDQHLSVANGIGSLLHVSVQPYNIGPGGLIIDYNT